MQDLKAVPCLLLPATLPSEAIAEFHAANSMRLARAIPRHACWDLTGNLLTEDTIIPRHGVLGMMAVRQLDSVSGVVCELPTAELVAVKYLEAAPGNRNPPGAL